MLKLVLFVFCALFALVSCSNTTDFEGIYTYGNYTIYVCQDGSYVSGRFGAEAIFYAKVRSQNSSEARGKYFYLGDLYTGTRVSYRRFTGGRGRLHLLAINSTAVEVVGAPKDVSHTTSFLYFVATKISSVVSTNSSTRIFDCAILDQNSTTTVAGHWNTSDNTQIDAHICLTNGTHGRSQAAMYGSYSFYFTTDGKETLPGYFQGYCAANAQLCGTIDYQLDTHYKSYSTFGAELIYRLSDGRLVIQHTRGAPGIVGFSFDIRANQLSRQGSASSSDCNMYLSSYFDPTKCKKFSLKECKALAPFGFCQIADDQGSCVRNHTVF